MEGLKSLMRLKHDLARVNKILAIREKAYGDFDKYSALFGVDKNKYYENFCSLVISQGEMDVVSDLIVAPEVNGHIYIDD